MKSIIIFGGSGYVGKNLIRSLVKKGYKIIVPYQRQINEANLRLLGEVGQIVPFHFTSLKNPKLLSILNNTDICINLKTTWESKEAYLEKSIYKFNAELIEIINKSSAIKKFIFFSGLGTEKRSTLRNEIISKTEELITKELNNSIIIRPSVILGNGDQFLSNLLPIFKMSFFIPLFGDGGRKFQPVSIEDIVKFLSNLIDLPNVDERLFELGGPDVFTYKEFYTLIAELMSKKRVFVSVPMPIIKPIVGIGEKTPFFPLNLEQLSLFDSDNILNNDKKGFDYVKMLPRKVISAVKKSI
ncbi:NAD-dependent epimerase/dehydratase family protein [Pelagibacterales bacterium SAG-MED31]|nr:NAD-dependent epimerase/dehydratase family protein [Pelagibacterales bacterium SAG-MED31]